MAPFLALELRAAVEAQSSCCQFLPEVSFWVEVGRREEREPGQGWSGVRPGEARAEGWAWPVDRDQMSKQELPQTLVSCLVGSFRPLVHTHTNTQKNTHVHTHEHIDMCMSTYTTIHICTCIHICINIHLHMHVIHMYTYMCTQVHTDVIYAYTCLQTWSYCSVVKRSPDYHL